MITARLTAPVAAWCLFVALASASETQSVFKTSVNVGATVTRGNSDTMLLNIGWSTVGEEESAGTLRVGAEANYGESTVEGNEETTVDNAKLFGAAERPLWSRMFAALSGSAAYDGIADVDYRVIAGPAMGLYLWRNKQAKLTIQAGPSYLWEKVEGIRHEFVTWQVVERFDYLFGETARVWQSAEWLPRSEEFEEYLLNAELGAEASITTRWKLRAVLQDKYSNRPPSDKKHNDLTLVAGCSLSF